MAYGTTLDSLNDAILREGMTKGQREDSFRNYLLGLAGERNRGRQVDVNAMDAGTRREGLGVTERLGNRQWDTEGRRVDVLGRDVDMRERLGMGQLDVQRGDIASRERIAGQQAAINQKIAETDALYKSGLITDMERARRNQELGITTQAGLEESRIKLAGEEIGRRYGHLGDRLRYDQTVSGNQFLLGMMDADTRAKSVANQYDVEILRLRQAGRIEEARIKQSEKELAVRRELGIGALSNESNRDALFNNRDWARIATGNKIADAQADLIRNPVPSEAYQLDVMTRNRAEQQAYDNAPFVRDILNQKIESTDGLFDWRENPEEAASIAMEPWANPSMRHMRFNSVTGRYELIPGSKPYVDALMPQRRTLPAANPTSQDPLDSFFPQPEPGANPPNPQPAPAPVDRRIQLPAGSSLPISPTNPISPMSWLLNPLTSAAASAMAPRPPGRQIVRLDANGNPL